MKTKSKLFLILFIIVTLLTPVVFATEPTEGEPVATSEENTDGENEATDGTETSEEEISEEDIINNDLFIAGDDIEISKWVDGNVYAMGKNVTISGRIAAARAAGISINDL